MRGTHILTDKTHEKAQLEVFQSLPVLRANTLHMAEKPLEGFMGFGVAITGASCY